MRNDPIKRAQNLAEQRNGKCLSLTGSHYKEKLLFECEKAFSLDDPSGY